MVGKAWLKEGLQGRGMNLLAHTSEQREYEDSIGFLSLPFLFSNGMVPLTSRVGLTQFVLSGKTHPKVCFRNTLGVLIQ